MRHSELDIRYRLWVTATAIGLVLFCVLLEAVTRLGFAHISHIESRIAESRHAALAIRPHPPLTQVLLLGNSLAIEGIDIVALQRAVAPSARITPFFIEGTAYFDWYFGLHRLFLEGSRPDVVILCLNTEQLLANSIRGEYSAFYLFDTHDLPEIRRDIGANLTGLSSLFLGRESLFYAGRTQLRNFLLGRMDPAYAALLHQLAVHPAPAPSVAEIGSTGTARLQSLRELCGKYGARFVFLLPPGGRHHQDELSTAARHSGASLLIPIDEGVLGPEMFSDGFHLNTAGRKIFTDRLGATLPEALRALDKH